MKNRLMIGTHFIFKYEHSRGYTLIELAMVMVILGLLFSGSLTAYGLYHTQSQKVETEDEINVIAQKLQEFRIRNGRYPCPSRINVARDTLNYGREAECVPSTRFNEACSNGVCKVLGRRNLDQIPFSIPKAEKAKIPARADVLIGTIPAFDLGLDADFVRDGYGGQYLYAVTADLAFKKPENFGLGSIEIVNENDENVLERRGNAAFVLLSFGPNLSGYETHDISACDRLMNLSDIRLETENCNMNSRFRVASFSTSDNYFFFDDVIYYTYNHASPKWQPLYNTAGDLYNRHAQSTTITIGHNRIANNLNVSIPEVDAGDIAIIDGSTSFPKLEIHGDIKGKQEISSQSICNPSIQSCFDHALIGGDGMECERNEFMLGIREGKPLCGNTFKCPYGYFLNRVGSNLTIEDCETLPTQCKEQKVIACDKEYILPAVKEFVILDLDAGFSKKHKYACQANQWEIVQEYGHCECKRDKRERQAPCQEGQSGHLLVKEEISCNGSNAGNWEVTQILENNCKCVEANDIQTAACTQGYVGELVQIRTLQCPSGDWGKWRIIQDNCIRGFDDASKQ